MEGTYLSWVNRQKSRGLLWVTLLFLLGGCSVVPNSQEGNGEEEEAVNQAFRGNKAASASCEQTNAKLDEVVRQVAQATKARQAHPSEEFEEAQRGGVQGPFLFTRSNTASPFVTRPEENDPQLSLSSEEEDVSTPQEILDRKFRDPRVVLTPNQSISLINYCTELGEQNAAHAAEKTVSIFLGNTGTGKSTTLNALLGCRMRAEFNSMDEEIIVVDSSSPLEEFMPIGHGRRSRTFMPQIAQDPDNPNRAHCDCPGFSDNRGAEINIANAINIRKILQQATGVKVVFLAEYSDLIGNRGNNMKVLESMCHQMFGDTENLRRYQDSALLGITKAPLYNRRGQPVSINSVRSRLTQNNTPIAQILANRIFLFDPLDRAMDNPDFWSLARCRDQIDRLASIPQREATTLFQTVLTDSDRTYLLNTIRQIRPKIVNAIREGDVTALGQHWQLLQRLRVIEHPEVEQLIEGQIVLAINNAILQQVDVVKDSANVFNFRDAKQRLNKLASIVSQLPNVPLVCNIDEIQMHIRHCEANKNNQEELKKRIDELNKAVEEAHKRLALPWYGNNWTGQARNER